MERKWHVGVFSPEMLKQWTDEGQAGQQKILESVPVYSALAAAKIQAESQNYTFNAPIINARNPEHEASEANGDIEALKQLMLQQPTVGDGSPNEYSFIKETDGKRALHYYRAVYLEETCMYCHGEPGSKHDIWDNGGIDGTGFPMDGKAVGDMPALSIQQDLGPADQALQKNLLIGGVTIAILLAIGGLTFVIMISRSVEGPIRDISEQLATGSNHVFEASHNMAQSSGKISLGASQSAASLEQTSASLEEIAAMVRQNSDNAVRASEQTKSVHGEINEGYASLDRMRETIHDIKAGSEQTAQIINTIDDIAFQTNLLALNAAVEAARALAMLGVALR